MPSIATARTYFNEGDIYLVGNSLTNDSVPTGYGPLWAAGAVPLQTAGYHIRSASSQTYIEANPSDVTFASPSIWNAALPARHWSYATFQPYAANSATLGTETTAIQAMAAAATTGVGQKFIYEGWPAISQFGSDYQAYWDDACADDPGTPMASRRLCFDHVQDMLGAGYFVIPVGSVFRRLDVEARAGNIPGAATVADFYRDDAHMGDAGKYVAAMTIYATIFRSLPLATSATIAPYQGGQGSLTLSTALADTLRTYVLDVVLNDPRTE